MNAVINFSYVFNHMIAIPVLLNGRKHSFIFDTGIGLTVISKKLADELRAPDYGTFTGKRMSGQDVPVPLTRVSSLEVGSVKREDCTVGIFDTSSFPPELSGISGIMSPAFFEDVIFAVDYGKNRILLGEEASAISEHAVATVPIEIERKGPSIAIFIYALLPTKKSLKLEVDSGSGALILDTSLMKELGIDKEGSSSKLYVGVDETGYSYKRYFSKIRGNLAINGAESVHHPDPEVVFQDIIYDGLLGNDFLKRYNVTYDLSNGKMWFSEKQISEM